MDFEFKKFHIKKTSFWATGSFKIFDSNQQLVYKTSSSIWQFKKKINFFSQDGSVNYTIKQKGTWPSKFDILEGDKVIARFEKSNPFAGKRIDVYSNEIEDFTIEGNVWGTTFKFFTKDEEIAMLSYNMWSTGEFGIAIKDKYSAPIIISVVIAIAYMKVSGQI